MTITRRRKEFLAGAMKIFQSTGQPVHYATLAQMLGVSKWTAYDVLRELEKEGLFTAEYFLNRAERYPGRSLVLFRPTPLAAYYLEANHAGADAATDDWEAVKNRLLGVLENITNIGPKKIIEELLEEIGTIEKPITHSAYIITILITFLSSLGNRGFHLLEQFVKTAAKPELSLSIFAGTALGVALKSVKKTLAKKLASKVNTFQKHLSEFNRSERKLLFNFLGEALQKATI